MTATSEQRRVEELFSESAHDYEEKRRQQHARQWLDYHARRSRRRYAATPTISSGLSVFRAIEKIGGLGRGVPIWASQEEPGGVRGWGIGAPRFCPIPSRADAPHERGFCQAINRR